MQKTKKQIIIEHYKLGLTQEQIEETTGFSKSLIKSYLNKCIKNEYLKSSELFNVNKYDCWIIPTKNEY